MRILFKRLLPLFLFVSVLQGAYATRTTFYFTGTCSDCTGTGTGQLVLQGYTQGTAINSSNFVSLTYSSNLINFTISQADSPSVGGMIPSSLPAAASVSVFGSTYTLFTQSRGNWCTGATQDCASDNGPAHTWSLTPPSPPATTATPAAGAPAVSEPVMFSLALGIAAMGAFLLKRHQARHSA
jgi:hypothetical protein